MFHDWFDCILFCIHFHRSENIFFSKWLTRSRDSERDQETCEWISAGYANKEDFHFRYHKICRNIRYKTKQRNITWRKHHVTMQQKYRVLIQYKMSSYQHKKSQCGEKTILRPSYLRNGISYTGKATSLYIWSGPRLFICICILLKLFQNHVSFRLSPSVVECTTYKYSCLYKWTHGSHVIEWNTILLVLHNLGNVR